MTYHNGERWINPSNQGIITSSFGYRYNPILNEREFHNGIDIAMEEKTEIYAVKSGVITEVRYSETLGNVIRYKADTNYEILYAHLSESFVNVGDVVHQGQVIALSGNTGLSTGPHLHYTIFRDGKLVNPLYYVYFTYTDNFLEEIKIREAL